MNVFSRWLAALMPGRRTDEPAPRQRTVHVPWNTPAGVHVSADDALKNAVVWACVTYLARTVGQLPWRVMRETPRGGERVPLHPVDYLLHKRPNPEMTSLAFREVMVGWAARRGNAVAEIQRDARSVPVALWPIHPSRLDFKRDPDTGELLYEVNNGAAAPTILRASDVLHVRGYGEGAVGLDVMSYAAETIGWAQATELFGASFFGNSARASGFLTSAAKLTPDGKKSLDREIKNKIGGPSKAHGVVILDAGMEWKQVSETPENAQFLQTMQHQVDAICRWFGVPPHKVMHLLRGTFSNIEHQSIEVVVDSITPWALRFEQETDHKLFGQNRQGFYTKMDLKGLLRGDFKSRQEGLQIMRRNGIVSANEWRRLEDMNEIGADGDKRIVEGNMTTLERVGQAAPNPAPAPAAADPADPSDDTDTTADNGSSPLQRARRQAARAQLH